MKESWAAGGAHAIQHSGIGEDIGTRTERPDGRAMAKFPAQRGKERPGHVVAHVGARQDKEAVGAAVACKAVMDEDDGAVRAERGFTTFGREAPFIKRLAGDEIGDAQWFDGAGKCDMGEFVDEIKDKALRFRHPLAPAVG